MEDNVDINTYSRSKYPNLDTIFLDEYKLGWAFRLIKHEISNKAIDNLMIVHTIKSNLPTGPFKSAHTLCKKLWAVELDGIGKHWISSTINYVAGNLETPYFWRDLMKILEDLLQNPS